MPQWLLGAGVALLVVVAVALVGGTARFRDVSSTPPYSTLVGRTCEIKTPLRSHGVTAIGSPHKKTDYVTVWEPGFTGPELTFVEYLPVGAKLRVLSARTCWNCPFDDLADFAVEVEPRPSAFADLPVHVRAETMVPKYVECRS